MVSTLQDDRVRLFTVERTNLGRTTIRRVLMTPELIEQGKKGWTLSRLWVMGHLGECPMSDPLRVALVARVQRISLS
jgi:hypothetical protein